ncbi:hypothetical protein MMC11_008589 [Xylographa trunciseda]|nr:hypothetical protein [Xylographa trunciseda]
MKRHWTPTTDDDDEDTSDGVLKPVIRELVRTRVYPPFLKLLVDKILIVPQVRKDGKSSEAYRVWLSDGEKSIQAALLRDVHPYFIFGQIREGSFVRITKYKLAKAKRLSGDGTVLHLLVDDLYAYGHDGRPKPSIEDARLKERRAAATSTYQRVLEAPSDEQIASKERVAEEATSSDNASSDEDPVDLVPWYDEQSEHKPAAVAVPEIHVESANRSKRRRHESPSPLQPVSPNVKHPPKHPRLSPKQSTTTHKPHNHLATSHPTSPTTLHHPFGNPPALLPITRPLRLKPLSHLTGPHATRNQVLDVFAAVASVTATLLKCPGMPAGTHYKRELRLADPSTPKLVMLSVFVAPHAFIPPVGTVALFRSVTTNPWDGGSLNAFARDCEGRQWFVPAPRDVPGCDVLGLRMWWLERQAERAVGRQDVEALLPGFG